MPWDEAQAFVVTMLDSAIAKKPDAICLAALSTDSVTDQLNKCIASKVPVIGFDSGVPGAPEGSIYANASTDNTAAGALAATSMYPAIQAMVKADGIADVAVVGHDMYKNDVAEKSAANGILDASDEGAKLGAIIAVGFDSGIRQKTAVRAGYFLGSITQDPYNIGYQAVELAYKAVMGEAVANVDTGTKFYTAANIDDASIKDLVYD